MTVDDEREAGQALTRGRRLGCATVEGAVLMGGSYKRCSGCGGRALSIATRCPGCGGEFPVAEEADGRPARKVGWPISLSMPVVVLAGAGIVVVSQIGRTASPREQRSSFGAAAPEIARRV